MLIVVMFITLALLCCAVTAVNDGRDGRWAAFMTIATVLAGRAVGAVDLALATSPGFKLLLDGALLIGYAALMLASRRFWPIWITGFQLNGNGRTAWSTPALACAARDADEEERRLSSPAPHRRSSICRFPAT